MSNILIISCIFGDKFKHVHNSPDKDNSFFFTNNKDIQNEIINKGWNYIYVDKPISDSIIISSLQSKYIKFLQFLDDYPQFKDKEIIIYFDHKEYISFDNLSHIKLLINSNLDKSIIIRQTPNLKNNIQDEVNIAMKQPRYAKNMYKTINLINQMVHTKKINKNVRICNTGLLIYINRHNIKKLLDNVYMNCIKHEQPECQIYWSIFSQKYNNNIKQIKWKEINNEREEP